MKKLLIVILSFSLLMGWNACTKDSSLNNGKAKSGSITRFAAVGRYLYCISAGRLDVYDAIKPEDPVKANSVVIDPKMETVFSYLDRLYIGSPDAVFIVDITNPVMPVVRSKTDHTMRGGCDPVVVKGTYACSTIRSGRACGNRIAELNILEVLDVSNPDAPVVKYSEQMHYPSGLAIQGNTLYVCDGANGLVVFDASTPPTLRRISTVKGIEAYDIIADGTNLIVSTLDGFSFYDASDIRNIRLQYTVKKS